MPRQPCADLGMLVGGVVVGDGMDQLAGWHGGLDGAEEADELLVAMLLHATADHAAVQHIESGKQCGGTVPLVDAMGCAAGTCDCGATTIAERFPMPQPNDLSRSLIPLDRETTLIAVIEMSQSSWLVAGIVP